MKKVRHYTLALIVKDDFILLGKKKRGFGKGLWNGFGGKIEDNETVQTALDREVFEECGLIVKDRKKVAELSFTFEESNTLMFCHVFLIESFEGQEKESEEMHPQWFLQADIPYADMWEDDKFWLPKVLSKQKLRGIFHFDKNDKMLSSKIDIVKDF